MADGSRTPSVVVAPVELDYASCVGFARDLDVAFGSAAGVIVADFAGTTFCDSSGLKVLVGAAKRAAASGRRFEVRSPSRMLCRMASILGASSLLGMPPCN